VSLREMISIIVLLHRSTPILWMEGIQATCRSSSSEQIPERLEHS
jgi:hypothetical protein